MRTKKITTEWELRTYDVWGNAKDGYEINDSFRNGKITLSLPVKTHNVGTPHEYQSASPSDTQIRAAFGYERVRIDTDGDDLTIYVNRSRDNYPIGEMLCTSHESLSPIREVANV